MPHVDIAMFPGRNNEIKTDLAKKIQKFLAKELAIDENVVSVSIEDVSKENWNTHIKKYSDKTIFISPKPISNI